MLNASIGPPSRRRGHPLPCDHIEEIYVIAPAASAPSSHKKTPLNTHKKTLIELGALAAGCYITKLPDTIAISDSEQRGKIDGFPHIGH